MQQNPYLYYLPILQEKQRFQVINSHIQAEFSCNDWESKMLNINQYQSNVLKQNPPVNLQVRGQFLLQVLYEPYTILSGFRFDYEVKFEVIQQLDKDQIKKFQQNYDVGLQFTFPGTENSNVKFICKNSLQFKKFIGVLQKKYIVQKNFHGIFQPIQKVGRGVSANVYKVCKVQTKQHLAIKTFKKQLYFATDNGNGKKAFQNQFKILTQVRHKNICQFQGVYETNNSIYLVMQFYEMSLLHYLQRTKKISQRLAKKIIKQLLQGIQHLHSKGLMHRDLKLENIMMKRTSVNNPEVVIIDLGLAQHVTNENFIYTRCGTPGYVAPQVLSIKANQNRRYTQKCDIFSLGVIFHILLFKKSLFEGKNLRQVIKSNSQCQINQDAQYFSSLSSQEALDLLFKMLKKDPQTRISAQQALNHNYFTQTCHKQSKNLQTSNRIQINL